MSGCGPVVVFVRVPALPRAACAEWTFTALISTHPPPSYQTRYEVRREGVLTAEEVMLCRGDRKCGAWLYTISEVFYFIIVIT